MEIDQPRALTGQISLICGSIFLAAGQALYYGRRQNSFDDLNTLAERNNVALTKAFANAIWPRYAAFLYSAKSLETGAMRDRPFITELREDTIQQMQGLASSRSKYTIWTI